MTAALGTDWLTPHALDTLPLCLRLSRSLSSPFPPPPTSFPPSPPASRACLNPSPAIYLYVLNGVRGRYPSYVLHLRYILRDQGPDTHVTYEAPQNKSLPIMSRLRDQSRNWQRRTLRCFLCFPAANKVTVYKNCLLICHLIGYEKIYDI